MAVTKITGAGLGLPNADGNALGGASNEWSDLYLADGGVIYFGNDQDVTITHDPDDGLFFKSIATADDNPLVLTLQTGETTMVADEPIAQIHFQAPDESSGTDAILIAATIQATAEGNWSSSSNATSLDFYTGNSAAAGSDGGSMILGSTGNLTLKDLRTADGSSPTLTLQSGDTNIAVSDVLGTINFQSPDEGAGTDAILVAAGIAAVSEGDFSSSNNATKLSFKTAASAAAAETMSLSSGGNLDVTGTIQGTTITAETAFVPDASDGAALGTASLEFSDLFLADGGIIKFGNDQDVTLTHVADTGILLNSTMAIQFNDASQYINAPSNAILDINATDEIELNATAVDLNGTLDVSGATTAAAITASGIIKTDDTTAATSTTDGSLQTDGGLSVAADAIIGDDLKLLSDAAVLSFGADSDVTVTHVADTGLTIKNAHTSGNSGIGAVLTLQTGDTDVADGNILGHIKFQAPNEGAGTDAILVAAGIAAESEGDFSSSNNATSLVFQTGASEAATTKMTLTSAGTLNLGDNILQRANLKDYGEVTSALGSAGGARTIDLEDGNSFSATVSASTVTWTFSNPTASDELCGFTLVQVNGGSQTVNWPGSVDWAGGTAPTLTSSGTDILVFFTIDGGTIWHGMVASTDSK